MAYQPVPQLTDEQKASLESEHEDVLVLRGDPDMSPWLMALRRPKRQETLGYKSHAKRDQTTANEQLIRKIAVYPVGNDLEKQLERWPFLPDGICDDERFKRFIGITVDADLK